MPNAKSHKLINEDIHRAVAADGMAREGEYDTTYDDGTKGKTRHMLYKDGDAVRSVPIADWPAEQQALAQRDAERAAYKASRQALRATAQALVGQNIHDLSTKEVRDLFALFLEQEGLLASDGTVLRDRRFGTKQGWE